MPSLMTIFGADDRQFQSVTARMAAKALASAKQIASGLASTALHLEAQIALAKRAGTSFAAYEAELAAVNVQLTAMNAEIAAQDALLAANSAETAANGMTKLGGAMKDGAQSGFNLNGILRESLVILREAGRGNWARIPGSISLLAQYMGVLRFVLNPVTLLLLAAGVAVYYLHKHVAELVKESKAMNDIFGENNRKFENAAMAIKQEAENMKEAAKAAADFNAWLEKLGISQETLATLADEHVRAMKEEFDIQQEIAKQRGQTDQQSRVRQQAERRKELAEYEKDLAKATEDEANSKAKATAAEREYESFLKSRQANDDPTSRLVEQARKLDKIWEQIDDKTRARMQALRETASGKGVTEKVVNLGGEQGTVTLSVASQMQDARQELDALYNKYFGGLEVDGKKVRASAAELDYIFADEAAKARYNAKLQADLAETEEQLKKELENYKTATTKDSETVKALKKKRDELVNTIDAHQKYDSQLLPGASHAVGGGRADVTERERIGAAGNQISVSLLDVSKQHLSVSKRILTAIQNKGNRDVEF